MNQKRQKTNQFEVGHVVFILKEINREKIFMLKTQGVNIVTQMPENNFIPWEGFVITRRYMVSGPMRSRFGRDAGFLLRLHRAKDIRDKPQSYVVPEKELDLVSDSCFREMMKVVKDQFYEALNYEGDDTFWLMSLKPFLYE